MRYTHAVLLVAAAAMLGSVAARAQGTLIRDPRHPIIHPGPGHWFSIESQYVDVDIENQVATTTITQVFHNNTGGDQEGIYLFPIPEKASLSRFTMWMNGEEVEGEIVEAKRARRIYEDIVRRLRDPGLLEYVGRDLFRARVYPIPARGDVRIKLTYEEVLGYDAGLVSYRYPLKTDTRRCGRIGELSVAVNIASDSPIKSVYSPSHDVDARVRGRKASCGFETRGASPETDFLLYYTVSTKDVGLNLLTHRINGKDGFFMMLVSPGDLADPDKVAAKEIVFVLDKSGSMKGEKIEQAKAALRYCVESLHRRDRFNVIAFSTSIDRFADHPVEATRRNVKRALDFVSGIDARGGTAIDEALGAALDLRRSKDPQMIIFLTDGLPTVGETDVRKILRNVERTNGGEVRVFPFGVGYDVNTVLLDELADDNGGTVDYIRPEEDIEEKVSRFYDKVASPVLSDVDLDTGDVRLVDVYPRSIHDIFNGTQMVLLGRYRDSGSTAIRLAGNVGDDDREFVYEGDFRRRERDNGYIPRLWASRKIAYLLSELKTHGHDRELVDEVIELSLEYGIVTPYTSYLILEEGTEHDRRRMSRMTPGTPVPEASDRSSWSFLKESAREPAPASGKASVEVSRELASAMDEAVVESDETGRVRYAGEKRFVLREGEWVDADFDEKMDVEEIEFLSDAYFGLLDRYPEVKDYLALGEKVTFVIDNKAYRITH